MLRAGIAGFLNQYHNSILFKSIKDTQKAKNRIQIQPG